MIRTKIKYKLVYRLAKQFFKSIKKQGNKNQRRGRPSKYDDAMILSIVTVMQLFSYSIIL